MEYRLHASLAEQDVSTKSYVKPHFAPYYYQLKC